MSFQQYYEPQWAARIQWKEGERGTQGLSVMSAYTACLVSSPAVTMTTQRSYASASTRRERKEGRIWSRGDACTIISVRSQPSTRSGPIHCVRLEEVMKGRWGDAVERGHTLDIVAFKGGSRTEGMGGEREGDARSCEEGMRDYEKEKESRGLSRIPLRSSDRAIPSSPREALVSPHHGHRIVYLRTTGVRPRAGNSLARRGWGLPAGRIWRAHPIFVVIVGENIAGRAWVSRSPSHMRAARAMRGMGYRGYGTLYESFSISLMDYIPLLSLTSDSQRFDVSSFAWRQFARRLGVSRLISSRWPRLVDIYEVIHSALCWKKELERAFKGWGGDGGHGGTGRGGKGCPTWPKLASEHRAGGAGPDLMAPRSMCERRERRLGNGQRKEINCAGKSGSK
ncbi:hypothetical protein FB451DRAFT_1165077 [Mycena latifolia]|nr:hypothetical protein FB451DRAFT_1165077 [Mycena latifolia]